MIYEIQGLTVLLDGEANVFQFEHLRRWVDGRLFAQSAILIEPEELAEKEFRRKVRKSES